MSDTDLPSADDLIDIGANLAHDSFDTDLEDVLQRASEAGVAQIVLTGSCAQSNRKALQIAQAHPQRLFSTAGLHPHHADQWSSGLASEIRDLAESAELVSLGECGLDYFRDFSPRPSQRRAFAAQLDIATDTGKPVFLHQRDAHEDFHAMLREYRSALGKVVVHCFTDTQAALEDYLALDCHVGITGWICDERRGRHLLDAVGIIPTDRLMIETDAPYLMPRTAPKVPHRRNEPANLIWVARAIAEATGRPLVDVAQQTSGVARAFFSLPVPA